MRKDRFEVKYYFPLERSDELFAYIKPFMQLDENIDSGRDIGSYDVESVYFDNDRFEYYVSHLEGYPQRRKVRIRKYTNGGKNHYFLEVKNKVLLATNKYRLQLSDELIEKASNAEKFEEFCELLFHLHNGEKISDMIHFDLLALKIKPVVYVRYKRIAFKSIYEHDVRLTLDYNIEASKAIRVFNFEHHLPSIKIIKEHVGVLELKSNRTMPVWLQDVLLAFRLTRTAFSKYQKSIEQIYKLY